MDSGSSPRNGPPLDIIIPVYNEGDNIGSLLKLLGEKVKTPFRALVCYDFDEDNTLPVLNNYKAYYDILKVKNQGEGVHGAVVTCFKKSKADCVIVFPADDMYNQAIIDEMYGKCKEGCDIVVASRFMKGGLMKGCPWIKSILVRTASLTLFWLSSIPVRDASNGFRLFSRRLLDSVHIESTQGFTYSLELLVKCRRLGWEIDEVPARWFERTKGKSRFRVVQWIPRYLKWYFYGLATTWLRKKPETVKIKRKLFNERAKKNSIFDC